MTTLVDTTVSGPLPLQAPAVDATWLSPTGWPSLADGDLHCWGASVPECADVLPAWEAMLDAEERARCAAFLVERDRTGFAVAHALMRVLLAHYAGASPSSLHFSTGPHGKPALLGHDARGLTFNLSHSGDVVLLAIAVRRAVGVDVEQWSPGMAPADLAETAEVAFSACERDVLRAAPVAEKRRTFFDTWARKEAYLKATGDGISVGLDHFDVTADAGEARLLVDRRDALAVERWGMQALAVGPGYSGAVAWQRESRRPPPVICTWRALPSRFASRPA